jgi:hypothetical protein
MLADTKANASSDPLFKNIIFFHVCEICFLFDIMVDFIIIIWAMLSPFKPQSTY